jgi:hypothetical protein
VFPRPTFSYSSRIPIFALLRVSCWRLVCGATSSYNRGVYTIIMHM